MPCKSDERVGTWKNTASSPTAMIQLPVELYEQIIDLILEPAYDSTKEALNLVLVSRSWVSRSRYHTTLDLDESRVRFKKMRTLVDLCQHPLSTLKFIGHLCVSNAGNIRIGTRDRLDHTAVNALFARMRTEPSFKKAMQVAQFPASQENGGRRPPRRAVSSNVSPGW